MDQTTTGPAGAARRRRADAQRSIDAILDAALDRVVADGEISMAAVARAAGVSRVTLYAHFPTREALLEAALNRAFATVSKELPKIAIDEDPAPQALSRLLRSSWANLARYRNLYAAAAAELPPSRLRDHHEPVLNSIERLVARGQADGDFRTDLPRDWLVATIYTLEHLAAEELNAARLSPQQAGDILSATVLSVLTGRPDPEHASSIHTRDDPN